MSTAAIRADRGLTGTGLFYIMMGQDLM